MTHATSIINQRIQEMSLDYLKLVCTNHNINISDQNLQIILYLIKNNSCTVIIPDYHPIIYIEIYNKTNATVLNDFKPKNVQTKSFLIFNEMSFRTIVIRY